MSPVPGSKLGAVLVVLFWRRWDKPQVIGDFLPGQTLNVDCTVGFHCHGRDSPHNNLRTTLA
jgi:hypothetical protein